MRCDTHCPPRAGLLGRVVAVVAQIAAVLAAVAVGVYVLSAVAGYLRAALVVVMAVNAAGIALFVRRVRPRQSAVKARSAAVPQMILRNEKAAAVAQIWESPAALAAPLAIEARLVFSVLGERGVSATALPGEPLPAEAERWRRGA